MTQIGSSVTVSSLQDIDQRDSLAYDLARDFLQGSTDDYLFFYLGSGQVDTSTYYHEYILIIGDIAVNTESGDYVCSDCQVVAMYPAEHFFLRQSDISLTGSTLDLSAAPVGTFEASGTFRDRQYDYYITSYTYYRDSVTVHPVSGYTCYSSLPLHPKLLEGVQYHAALQNVLLVAVFAFVLADRIFRRIY